MLKKVGIVTAGVTAGLLAVSPLAFAGDGDSDQGHRGGGTAVSDNQVNSIDQSRGDNQQLGLVNTGDINALNNANVLSCSLNNADIAANVLGILAGPVGNSGDDATVAECSPGSVEQTNIDD